MRILVLVGPKGCSKSFVGRLMEKGVSNTTFFDVEKIAIDFIDKSGGSAELFINSHSWHSLFFEQVCNKIEYFVATTLPDDFGNDSILIFETTGAAPETKAFLDDLKHFGLIHLVQIRPSTSTCAERIRSRDCSRQVDVPLEMIECLHAVT